MRGVIYAFAGLMLLVSVARAAETVTLGTLRLTVRRLVSDDFSRASKQWALHGDGSASVKGGALHAMAVRGGRPACATVWYNRPFKGDLLIRFRARLVKGRTSGAAGCFFMASSLQGARFSSRSRSSSARALRKTANYLVALCGDRAAVGGQRSGETPPAFRLYRNPQQIVVDENPTFKSAGGVNYAVAIARIGDEINVYINGGAATLWKDREMTAGHQEGYVGLHAEGVEVRFDDFSVASITSWSALPITTLKKMYMETDLRKCRLVIGSAPLHRDLATKIAAGIKSKTGIQPAIVYEEDMVKELPGSDPLIVLGNLANNGVIRRLYLEWFCMVDRCFPGEGGYVLQTIHNPWAAKKNVVVIGASDDGGIEAAAERFAALVPKNGRLGYLYEARPGPAFAGMRGWDFKTQPHLTLPLGYPHHHSIGRGAPQYAMLYLLLGEERYAKAYRQAMLKQVDIGLVSHLYLPSWPVMWDLMEEHPVFSDDERLKITNWFLSQLRSSEAIHALHIDLTHKGQPHQNHGTRPALGSFFMARYFRDHYKLPEADAYLSRLHWYFGCQENWSKPMCDSSLHQWQATLENKATYALASRELGFFESGAARQAAERALRTTNNTGFLPIIGDSAYGVGADSLLAKCAFYYNDGRYLWPSKQRGDIVCSNDEIGRAFAGDVAVKPPKDIVGVSVIPYDKGFYSAWQYLAGRYGLSRPNTSLEKAFDKITFRTGIGRNDEFLLLDGMLGASHDYDDTNTVHEYSRNGRVYIGTYDGLPSPTIAHHNGVNIIRDGISAALPSCAELLHAEDLRRVMVSQTRLEDFSDADWVRSIVLVPGNYFVVIDRVEARKAGTFTFTGHWRMLGIGEPKLEGDTLTTVQCPKGEKAGPDNETYFHMQALGDRVSHKQLPYRYGLSARFYPYARPFPNVLAQSKTALLKRRESGFLYALGHETGHNQEACFIMREVAPGVVRVTDGKAGAYVGVAEKGVKIADIEVDADLFYLDARTVAVVGGRKVVLSDSVILDAPEPVAFALDLATGKVLRSAVLKVQITAPSEDLRTTLERQLASGVHDRSGAPGGSQVPEVPPLERLWTFNAGGATSTLRTENLPVDLGVVAVPSRKGHVSFLDAAGKEVHRVEVGVPVNDVAVADVERDGPVELLIAREDCKLECRTLAGETRFTFQPKQEQIVNSALWLGKNSAQRVWVADHDGKGEKTIVVSTGDQRVHGLAPSGERKWMFWAYAGIFTTFGLCDVDGDGWKEMVGGNGEISAYDTIWFLKGKDTFYKRVESDGWGSKLTSMAVGDINGDGKDEIVIGTGRATLRAINPATQQLMWMHRLGDDVKGVVIVKGPEGKALVVAGSASKFVTAFDGSGKKQWATPVRAPVLFLTSVRAKGRTSIVAACEGGQVLALDPSGKVTHRLKLDARPVAITTAKGHLAPVFIAAENGIVTAFTVPEK